VHTLRFISGFVVGFLSLVDFFLGFVWIADFGLVPLCICGLQY
jgi:hypothetical protein